MKFTFWSIAFLIWTQTELYGRSIVVGDEIGNEDDRNSRTSPIDFRSASAIWIRQRQKRRTTDRFLVDESENQIDRNLPLETLMRLAETIRKRRQASDFENRKYTSTLSPIADSESTDYLENSLAIVAEKSKNSNSNLDADSKRRPRQKLLIGYLGGLPFGNLGDTIDTMLRGAGSSSSSSANKSQLLKRVYPIVAGQPPDSKARSRRMADPYADPYPDAYPDPYPDAYPDAYPLDTLHISNYNTTTKITFEDLTKIFAKNDILSTSKNLQGHLVSGAIRYALEVVNNDPDLLPDYELTFKFFNTRGLTKESVQSVMELWRMGAIAFIGPEDSCQTEAMMAAAQNLPMISYKCADHSVSDKSKYGTFARTVPAEGEVAKGTVAFLKHYKWYKFTIVHQADEVHKQMVDGILYWVEKYPYMTVQNTTSYRSSFNIDTLSSSREVKQIVEETYQTTRIYVVLGDQGFLQLLLLEMSNFSGSTNLFAKGEYAVVYVDHSYGYIDADDAAMNRYYRPTIYQANSSLPVFGRLVDVSRSLFVIIPTPVSFSSEYRTFWSKVTQYNTEEPFQVLRLKNFSPSSRNRSETLNPQEPIANRYASYLYDAVLLYARALHETIQAKGNFTNGTAIIKRILGRKYRSMQGFDVTIDKHGDATGNFTLLTRQNITRSRYNFSHSMVPTAWFVETQTDDLPALALHKKMYIDWVGGKPPDDEPECGFHNERCIKEPSRTGEIAGSILAVLFVVGGLIGLMVYRNWKIEKELAGLIWKIDPKEIQFITQDGYAAVIGASRATLVSQDSAGQETSSLWPIDFHCLAKYRGALVAIKEIQYARKLREITRATKMEMKKMRGLHHDNVNNFMGIIVKTNQIYVVREYCAKGSLYDVLLNENIKLDELFTASFVDDLLKAMCYLHESELRVHGNLKSTNCVVTSRWSLQVADYGLHELRDGQQFENEMQRYKALLWTAPELLLAGAIDRPERGTQKGDVFSFGIVLHEIFSRTGPYGIESDCNFSARDLYILIVKTRQYQSNVVHSIQRADEDLQILGLVNTTKPFLPNLDDIQCQNYVKEALTQCWDERPQERPDFRTIRQRLKPLFKGILRRNIMDHMMAMMEKYQNHLEQLVDERTEALNEEKKRVEVLLQRMLPDSVASQLMRGEDVVPESYDAVTIYFSDIVGFTSLSAESTPMEVVNFLNTLYTLFDSIIRRYDVYKVETIGDAYMVVSGLPIRNGDKHAGEIATMALHLLKAVDTFQIPHRPDKKLLLRIGLHTGPCVAGVVGKTMPRYCLFGDTVNTASRMESNGLPLKIHCSEYVERALATIGGYILEERGLVPMKGKGEMLTYWLLAKQEFVMASPVDEFPSEPLFKTKDNVRPPSGNITRRRIAAESLHQLPSRGESLTTVIRRTPSKRTDAGSSAAGSKLLQPAPAFSSTVGKPSSSTGGGGSSRNSRILLPTTTTPDNSTSSAAATDGNRQKLPPLILSKKSEMPPSYQDCVRTNTSKRPSLRTACTDRGGVRLKRQLSSDSRDRDSTLRKRSVSFPENVQALAEQFVSLGLTKDGRNATNMRDANGNVTADSSMASSTLHTPRGKSPNARSRNCTPDRNNRPTNLNSDGLGPSILRHGSDQCADFQHLRRAPSEKLKNVKPATWEDFGNGNLQPPIANDNTKRNYRIIDSDEEDDEGSPVPRKRSLSCGDAGNLAMIGAGSQLIDATTASSDPQHIERALLLSLTNSSTTPLQQQPLVGGSSSASSRNSNQIPINGHRYRQKKDKEFTMENPDEDSPSDSPLLLKAEPSASFSGAVGSGSIIDRHNKRKRKSAVSLQAFSRPFHIWQGHDSPTMSQETTVGLASGGQNDGQGIGGGSRLNRFLRFLKKPLSDDPMEIGVQRQPSLV